MRFLTNFEARYIQFEDRFRKNVLEHCCKLSQDFKSVFRSRFGWCWIDFYSLAWKLHLNFSIAQLWRAYQSRWDQVWAWFRKLLLRSTKWYINHVNCMHQSEDKACQSWRIIAKFGTFKQLYWLNQVTRIFATPAKILTIFFSTKPNQNCVGLVRKVDLLSISFGLKIVLLAEPSDQYSGRPGHNS